MGLWLNEDCNHFLWTRQHVAEPIDEAYLRGFIDQYVGTGVTHFVMNVAATLSFVPSEVRQFAADKYTVKTEMGKVVDYSQTELAVAYRLWYEAGLDMYQIWIDQCRRRAIRPWFSFRMNDAELVNVPNHLLSEYYYQHLTDQARVRHRPPQSPWETCRDYEVEEYRQRFLDYINEVLLRYDVDGIELDFQREMFCFQLGHEWDGRAVMTAFVRSVRELTRAASVRYGHKVELLVRVHPYPESALELGFDVAEWAGQGLVDVIVPSPNWFTSNNGMQLTLWSRLMEPYGVKVIGCLDANLNSNPDYYEVIFREHAQKGMRRHSFETLCAGAANILSQVPPDLYLFNWMDCPAEVGEAGRRVFGDPVLYRRVLGTVGDLSRIMACPRRHVVTYDDTPLPWSRGDAVLPLTFSGDITRRYVRIETGAVPSGRECVLRLGMAEERDVTVYVNSVKVDYIGRCSCEEPVLTESALSCFRIPPEAMKQQAQIVEIEAADLTVDYVDLRIEAAE